MRRSVVPISLTQIDWTMTSALAATGFMLVGICAIAVGLLHDPLIADFHWNNASVSGLATVYSLAALLSGPIAGVVIDRFGSKIVMTVGMGCVALGFFGMSYCSVLAGFYAAFVLIGIGYGGAFYLASTKIIATRMGDQKNIGMGIWMFAGSLGAAFFSLAVDWSIREHGWRSTCIIAALLILGSIPATLLFIPRDDLVGAGAMERPAESRRLPPMRLLMSPEFVVMTAASSFAAFGMSAINFHLVPIFVKAGFSDKSASAVLGASWILSALGSLSGGALSDRMGTRKVLAGSLLLGAVGAAALMLAQYAQVGMLAVIAFVVLWGATANAINQFLPLLLVDYYGPSHLGALVGIQGALMGLVGSFAPFITGSLYDRYSSYGVSIIASVTTTSVALILVGLLRPKQKVGAVDGQVATSPGPLAL